MISDIVTGVCEKLTEEFIEDFGKVRVYSDNVSRKAGALDSKSALRQPNFFVSCKSPSGTRARDRFFTNTQLLGNRYLRGYAFCVECRWFPDWRDILERLFLSMEYINVGKNGSVIRGNSMQGEYDDKTDVLYFFVNYDVFVFHEKEKIKMEKMTNNFQFTIDN
jgi:hypothetical protein